MLLNFKKKQKTEPRIFFIALHAQSEGNVLIWNTAVAAYSVETAKSEALLNLQAQNPALYQQGRNLGGWNVQNHIELSATKLDIMLTEAADAHDDIHLEKEKQERNELMQTIIDTASRKLLNKYKDEFTLAEVAYLEDEIQKYERQN